MAIELDNLMKVMVDEIKDDEKPTPPAVQSGWWSWLFS
jgi:hypothetical protein